MVELELLRWAAAAACVTGAALVAAGDGARATAAAFGLFAAASAGWIVAAIATKETALLAQNAVLLAVNLAGLRRWAAEARADRRDGAGRWTADRPD
jgi:hypothetical protein